MPSGGAPRVRRAWWNLQRECHTPGSSGPVPKWHDLELAPGVAPIGGVVGGPRRLASGGRAEQEGVGLEACRGIVHGHRPLMDAEGAGEAGHPDKGVQVDANGESGVVCAEALLDHQLLGVVGPSLDERLREQAAPDIPPGELAEHPAMGEMTGRYLVHGDGGTHGGAEGGQPFMLGLLVPGLIGRADVIARRGAVLEGAGPVHHGRSPAPGRRAGPTSQVPPRGGRRSLLTKAVASSIVSRAAA